MNKIFKVSKHVFDIFFFALAFLIVVSVAYYFGWTLLRGQINWGNDAPFASAFIYYLARWYPHIPSWAYSWAGGMPYLLTYSVLPTLITFFLHLFSNWTIPQSMRFIFWLSIPLAALGVAVLGRITTKNWIVGILAGVMMIISPDSWMWVTQGGFYGFSVSVPAFAWATVMFVLACEHRKKLYWVLASLTYGLTWLFHPMSGVLLTIVIFAIGIGYAWQSKEKLTKGFFRTILIMLGGVGSIAWWMIPFYTTRQNQGIGISAESLAYVTPRELIGLEFARDSVYITSTIFAVSVVILFGVGIVAAFMRKSVLRSMVVACFIALIIMMIPPYLPLSVNKILIIFWESTNVRSALILRILGPVIAAYGAASLARPLFWLIEKLVQKIKTNIIWKFMSGLIESVVGVLVFVFIFKNIVTIPPMPKNLGWVYLGYGPMYSWEVMTQKDGNYYVNFDGTNYKLFPDISTVVKTILQGKIKVDDSNFAFNKQGIQDLAKSLGLTNKDRLEIPPFSGQLSGAIDSILDITQIPSYLGITSISRMWGWQVTCFYYDATCGPTEVNDLSRWFGIWGVWVGGKNSFGPTTDKTLNKISGSTLYKYQKYELNAPSGTEEWNTYQFLDSSGLMSMTDKPTLLILGNNPPNSDVFDTVFRGLSRIDFGYSKAWSVRGGRYIDDYSLSELSKFDAIILYGQRYHNRDKAWNLLEEYVNSGGRLLVDTGWQYLNDDWGKMQGNTIIPLDMPKVLPVTQTLWGNIGTSWNISLSNTSNYSGVGTSDWGTITYSGSPWGMALANKSSLKNGAEAIVSSGDKVLVAGWNYGKGKVVWTGFDFWGHLNTGGGTDEKLFLNKVLTWLTSGKSGTFEQKLDFQRVNPDLITTKVGKTLQGTKLMFKEAATNNWKAKVTYSGKTKSLSIYPAGPGWKMVILPQMDSGGKIEFYYHKTFFEIFGILISLVSIVCLLGYLFGWGKSSISKIKQLIAQKASEKFSKFKKIWENENE